MKSKKILSLVLAAITTTSVLPVAAAHAATLTATSNSVIAGASTYQDSELGQVQYSTNQNWGNSNYNQSYLCEDGETGVMTSWYILTAKPGDTVTFSAAGGGYSNNYYSINIENFANNAWSSAFGFASDKGINTAGSISFKMPAATSKAIFVRSYGSFGDDTYGTSNERLKLIPLAVPDTSNKSSEQAVKVQQALLNYVANNSTSVGDLQNLANSNIDSGYAVSVSQTGYVSATEGSDGYISGNATVTDTSNGQQTTTSFAIRISKLAQSLNTIATSLSNFIKGYGATNGSAQTDFTNAVKITNTAYNVSVSNWLLKQATDTTEGKLTGTVNINQGSTVVQSFPISKTIAELPTTTATAKSIISGIIKNYVATNESDKDALLSSLQSAVGSNITLNIDPWKLSEASETQNGSLEGLISISDGTTTDSVPIDKQIQVEEQSVETVKSLFTTALENFKGSNSTTDQNILDSVLITNPNIKSTISDFKIGQADENKSGKITGNVNIENSETGETATVPISIKIAQLPLSVATIQSLYDKAINNFVATNSIQPGDLLSLVYINNEDISVKMEDDYNVKYADDTDKGLVNGTILITNNETGETAEVQVNKEISLLSQGLSTAVRDVQNTIYSYNPNNDSTFEDLLMKCNNVVTKNITVFYKIGEQPEKVNSDEFNDGYMKATMEVTDGTTTVEIPFTITIGKTAQTLDGLKTLMDATLKNFKATNATTDKDVLNAVDTNIRDDSINAAFGTTGAAAFYKEYATEFKPGKITGEINVSNATDSVQLPVELKIDQLDETVDQAEKAIDIALPTFIVNNDTEESDIKAQIEKVVSSNIVVTTKDFKKDKATLDATGEIKVTAVLVDKNTGATKEVPLDLTIQKLKQSLDEAENSVKNTLSNMTGSNTTTAKDVENALQNSVGNNISVTVGDDFENHNSTTTAPGKITGTITITNTDTGEFVQIPLDLDIPQLAPSGNISTGGNGGSSSGGSGSSSHDSSTDDISTQDQSNTTATEKNSSGWQNINGVWHYYNSDGSMVTGWIEINGLWYYFNSDGSMVTGWLNNNGHWYYLNTEAGQTLGAMETGWQNINNVWYYLNPNEGGPMGSMQIGWLNYNNAWYYLNSSGAMQAGWLNYNGTWYYMASNGSMAEGWFHDVDGNWYYLNQDGSMQIGWFQDSDGTWYYLNSDGSMAANTTIDGYYLDDSGAWVQ